jgi:hypothetical protein
MDDVERVSEHIQSSPLNEGDEVRLAFLPTYNQAEWHFACEDFMSSKLFNTSRKPSIKGAMAKCGRAWAYWVHDFNDDKLILLRLHAESGTPDTTSPGALPLQVSIVDILWAAQQEAHSWELEKVVVWDPSPLVLAACKEVLGRELAPRRRADGSIPCLRWKGGENKKVDWVYIEKYSWC